MNSRNQVATLNSMSLQHDAFGRRTRNLQNTSFLFDGANTVQELAGSTPTANLISGGIDEIFARADSSGAFTPLKDALGSTVALVDASGNLATQYAYDPFGNTTVSGAINSNAFQYTGRENEGNGLYFYRARYYSTVLGRFISQDPLGFGAGVNFYAYVFDSPTNLRDPTGLGGGIPMPAGIFAGRKDDQKWWHDFWHAFWYGSGPKFHGCTLDGKPYPGSEILCDEQGHFAGEAPGAISADAMNGAIVLNGGGLFMSALPTEDVGLYLAGKAPFQVTPGVTQLQGQYINDLGRIEPWTATYDEFGRLIARTDYNAGNAAQGIPNIHYHTYDWGPGKLPLETGSHIPGEYPH